MSPDRIKHAADLLIDARRRRRAVILPDDCRPQNENEAYAIQHMVTERLGLPLIGWKVGAAARDVAEAEGAAHAVSGRLFAPHVRRSPARMGDDLFTCFRNCEVEFVMRIDRNFTARREPYTTAQVADAVDAVFPAIEIGDSRLADRATAGMLCICADNAGGTELVLGEEITAWQELDLPGHRVRLIFNDAEVAQGCGGDVMGDPLNSLTWLINQQSGRGCDVPAGALAATGSCTGINIAQPGDEVTADFGRLGSVQITFA